MYKKNLSIYCFWFIIISTVLVFSSQAYSQIQSKANASPWTQLPSPTGGFIINIALEKSNPQHLLALNKGGLQNSKSILYNSIDGGSHWQKQTTPFDNDDIYSMASANGNIFVVAFPSNSISVTYKSSDYGKTWEKLSNIPQGSKLYASGNNLYAMGYGSNHEFLFLSTDAGSSWERLNFNPSMQDQYDIISAHDKTIYLARDPSSIILGDDKIAKSTDGGQSFSMITLPNKAIATDLLNLGNTLIVGTQKQGIYSTTDGGAHWNNLNNGLPASSPIYKLGIYGSTFLASTAKGIYTSTDGGKNWKQASFAGKSVPVVSHFISTTYDALYAATKNDGILKSTDHGQSWQTVNTGITADLENIYAWNNTLYAQGSGDNIYKADENKNSTWDIINQDLPASQWGFNLNWYHNTLYATDYGNAIYNSTDGGTTWTKLNTPFSNPLWLSQTKDNIYAFANSNLKTADIYASSDGSTWTKLPPVPQDIMYFFPTPSALFAETSLGNWFRSINNGQSWTNISMPSEDMLHNFFYYQGTIYFFTADSGIFTSSNEGDSWQNSLNLLGEQSVNDFVEYNSKIYIYGSLISKPNQSGLYATADNGKTWKEILPGLPNATVNVIAIANNKVYLATSVNGIYYATLGRL